MKKTERFLFTIVCFCALISIFSQCDSERYKREKKIKEIRSSLSTKNENNPAFESIKSLSTIDSEVAYILDAKKENDWARINLIKVLESTEHIDEVGELKKQIMRMQKLGTSVQSAANKFKDHLIMILAQSDDGTNYWEAKKDESKFKEIEYEEAAQNVLDCLTEYGEQEDQYTSILLTVLENVESEDIISAGNSLNSDEILSYYMSVAKMLSSLYDFEAFRAELICSAAEFME